MARSLTREQYQRAIVKVVPSKSENARSRNLSPAGWKNRARFEKDLL